MKKPKIGASFGDKGFKGFMAAHVEKFVAGFVLLGAALLVVNPFGEEASNAGGTPTDLKNGAIQAMAHVNTDFSDEIMKLERENTNFPDRAKKSRNAADSGQYPLVRSLARPGSAQQGKRSDPKTFAATDVQAVALFGPLAWKSEDDPLAALDNATKPTGKKKRRSSKKKRRGGRGQGLAGGGFPGGGAGGGGLAGGGFPGGGAGGGGLAGGGFPGGGAGGGGEEGGGELMASTEWFMPSGYAGTYRIGGGGGSAAGGGGGGMAGGAGGGGMASGAGMAGGGGMASGAGMAGGGGMASGAGMAGGAAGGGMASGAGMAGGGAAGGGAAGGAAAGGGGAEAASSGMIARFKSFIMIHALVPFEDQHREFETIFSNAAMYDPARDFPTYASVHVQRVEVTDASQEIDEAAWQDIETWRSDWWKDKWTEHSTMVQEIADPSYLDPVLTQPVPPILLADLQPLLLPEDKLEKLPPSQAQLTTVEATEETAQTDDTGPQLPSRNRRKSTAAGGAGMGGMGGGMASGAGMAGGGGMASGAGMAGGGGMASGAGMAGGGGMASGAGMAGGGGMASGAGMAGGGGMGAAIGGNRTVSKYKLVRFFDFDAEPGKKYRYRIRLALEDPNNSPNAGQEVPLRHLDATALKRVQQQRASEADLIPKYKALKYEDEDAKAEAHREACQITTDWSEATNVVALPSLDRFYAGNVPRNDPKSIKLGNGETLTYQSGEIQGTLLPVAFDPEHAVHVPCARSVLRGSVLNFTANANVAHPISMLIKSMPDYDFRLNALVVDIRGGERLPGNTRDPLLSPAEFAVIDANGEFIVQSELDDMDEFRKFTYYEEDTPATDGSGGMGGMGGGGGAGAPAGLNPFGPGGGQ